MLLIVNFNNKLEEFFNSILPLSFCFSKNKGIPYYFTYTHTTHNIQFPTSSNKSGSMDEYFMGNVSPTKNRLSTSTSSIME